MQILAQRESPAGRRCRSCLDFAPAAAAAPMVGSLRLLEEGKAVGDWELAERRDAIGECIQW